MFDANFDSFPLMSNFPFLKHKFPGEHIVREHCSVGGGGDMGVVAAVRIHCGYVRELFG